jgi:hypothetical protein
MSKITYFSNGKCRKSRVSQMENVENHAFLTIGYYRYYRKNQLLSLSLSLSVKKSLSVIPDAGYTVGTPRRVHKGCSVSAIQWPGPAQPGQCQADAAKHPAGAQPSSFQTQPTDTPQMSFTADHVMKVIMSFRKGSAPGPSGLRAEHLRAATQSAPANRRAKALEAVGRLVNIMSAGDLPDEVAPYLSGARMQAGRMGD